LQGEPILALVRKLCVMNDRLFRNSCTILVAAICGSEFFQTALAGADDAGFYPTKVWGELSGGEMNTSSFVFRDCNGNGLYDVGDRPMANVAVVMSSASQPPRTQRTNISGFANFTMSAVQRERDIVEPGRYDFRVVPPPDWTITTDNVVQTSEFQRLPGAPGDMVSVNAPKPVGLAPSLYIRGTIDAPNGKVEVMAAGPDGHEMSVPVDGQGSFRIPASQGRWVIEVLDRQTQAKTERTVDVGRVPVVLSKIRPGDDDEKGSSSIRLVNFDTLMIGEAVQKIPSGFARVNWHNWVDTHNRFYDGEGYINGTMSGEYVAYNGSGHPAAIDSAEPFDFVGGFFSVAWSEVEGETLHIKAWRGELLLHEDQLALSAMGPVYFDAGYTGLTRLELRTEHFWQFVSDDLRLGLR
jgi:hypothetical protein